MWPFRRKLTSQSQAITHWDNTLEEVQRLIDDLDRGVNIDDHEIRRLYFSLESQLKTNCESAANGLLKTIGAICVHAPHLVSEFMPSALQPIYYLDLEDYAGIRDYICSVANDSSYLNMQTPAGNRFLKKTVENRELIVESFRTMFEAEDNEWRKADANIPDVPAILMESLG